MKNVSQVFINLIHRYPRLFSHFTRKNKAIEHNIIELCDFTEHEPSLDTLERFVLSKIFQDAMRKMRLNSYIF